MSNLFENEVLETETVTPPTVSVAREIEAVVFEPETGEVIEEPVLNVVQVPRAGSPKRIKRTEAQMVAALGGSSLKEATYVLDRVAKLEDKISELLGHISQKGRDRVFEERPDLKRY